MHTQGVRLSPTHKAFGQGLRKKAVYVFGEWASDARPANWTVNGFQLSVSFRVGGPACTLSAIEASKMFCGIKQGYAEISGLGWRFVPGIRHNTTSVISGLETNCALRSGKRFGGGVLFFSRRDGRKKILEGTGSK